MRIEWCGPVFDGSGYGEASRNYVMALHSLGVDVLLRPLAFDRNPPNLGYAGDFLRSLIRETMPKCDLRVIHCTPDLMPSVLKDRPMIPTIGYATWETNKLPPGWAEAINSTCQALWVPSNHNVKAFRDSGVTVPIHRVPHCFADLPVPEKATLERDGRFRFLNVGQWLTRKNQLGLLMAYLTEFKAEEKVSLVLKTFTETHSPGERDQIKGFIQEIKRQLHLSSYPQVELIVANLSKDEMTRLNHDCDCIVSLHRCEGFGITIAEGMLAGKPVIVTENAGTDDFTGNCSSCWSVHSQPAVVFGMPWSTYTGDMVWRDPDLCGAKAAMRDVFSRRGINTGDAGRRKILDELSFHAVGSQMKGLMEAMCASST